MKAPHKYSDATVFALGILSRMINQTYHEERNSLGEVKCFTALNSRRIERERGLDWSCVQYEFHLFCMIEKNEIVKMHASIRHINSLIEGDTKLDEDKRLVFSMNGLSPFCVLLNTIRTLRKLYEMFEKQEREFPWTGVITN